jgi:hypothetical protein
MTLNFNSCKSLLSYSDRLTPGEMKYSNGQWQKLNADYGTYGTPFVDMSNISNRIFFDNGTYRTFDNSYLEKGKTYYIYHIIAVDGSITKASSLITIDSISFNGPNSTLTATLSPYGNVSMITKSGLLSVVDYTKYMLFNGNEVRMRIGNYALGIDSYGPYIVSGGATYRFNTSNMTKDTTHAKTLE